MRSTAAFCVLILAFLVASPGPAWADEATKSVRDESSVSNNDGAPDDSKVISFGHNVSSTTDILKPGVCTFGLQALACGLSDRAMIGTSPWLTYSYNMYNALFRYRISENEFGGRHAVQAGYFKTYPGNKAGGDEYDMEAGWLTYIRSFKVNPHYTLHLNAQVIYYWNDHHPFSLRRPWPDRHHEQYNISGLNEIHLTGGWFVNFEVGILGLTQQYYDVHLGTTLEYRTHWWLAHAGISQTSSLSGYKSPLTRADYQQQLRKDPAGFNQDLSEQRIHDDYSIHPEFTLQVFF